MANPGWLEDPTGKHQYRYWDGAQWSDQVSDDGQVSTDDLSPAPPPSDLMPAASAVGSPLPPSSSTASPTSWGEPQAAKPEGRKTWIIIGGVVVGLLALLLIAGGILAFTSSSDSTHKVSGTLSLIDSDIGGTEHSCYGTGGYDDIEAGVQVTVKSGSGKTLGVSELRGGEASDDMSVCTFHFQVDDVPDSKFYEITASHRGGLSYSKAEMEDNKWIVLLSLGS